MCAISELYFKQISTLFPQSLKRLYQKLRGQRGTEKQVVTNKIHKRPSLCLALESNKPVIIIVVFTLLL